MHVIYYCNRTKLGLVFVALVLYGKTASTKSVVYGTLESVTMLWCSKNYHVIVSIIIQIINPLQ